MRMKGNFGFIHEKIDIKVLILFILRRLPGPVTFNELTELTLCDDGISYFDYSECVTELVKTEHILLEGEKYSLTAKGARNGEILENSLPFSVRMYADNHTSRFRTKMDRNSMIRTAHESDTDGSHNVSLTLSDGVGDIISLKLFTVNEQQAQELENGFRKNAESIYNALIEMILG